MLWPPMPPKGLQLLVYACCRPADTIVVPYFLLAVVGDAVPLCAGTMALWHKGKKVGAGFGKRIRAAEIIKLELNRDAGTLSIWQDGNPLGVAFSDLPRGVPLFPAVSMYNQEDRVTLIDPDNVASRLSSTAAPFRPFSPVPAPAPEPVRMTLESRRAERERSVLENVPASRMAKAETLSSMGWKLEWCIKGLAATRDNPEAAADWILTNQDKLEAESAAEESRKAEAEKKKAMDAESDFFAFLGTGAGAGVASQQTPAASTGASGVASAGAADPAGAAWTCGLCTVVNPGGEVVCVVCASDRPLAIATPPTAYVPATFGAVVSPAAGSTAGSTAAATAGANAGATAGAGAAGGPWGFRAVIVPQFPVSHLQSLVERGSPFVASIRAENAQWTLAQDESLVDLVNVVCDRLDASPVDLLPDQLKPGDDELMALPLLSTKSVDDLQLRFLVLRNFNRRMVAAMDLVDLSRTDAESWIVAGIRRLRGLVFRRSKLQLWRRVIAATNAKDGRYDAC